MCLLNAMQYRSGKCDNSGKLQRACSCYLLHFTARRLCKRLVQVYFTRGRVCLLHAANERLAERSSEHSISFLWKFVVFLRKRYNNVRPSFFPLIMETVFSPVFSYINKKGNYLLALRFFTAYFTSDKLLTEFIRVLWN